MAISSIGHLGVYPVFLLMLLGLMSFSLNADSADKTTLIFDAPDTCPFICPGKDKPGIMIEIVDKVFEGSEYVIEWRYVPWVRGIYEANEGAVNALLGPTLTEAPELSFPTNEVFNQLTCFYVRTDDDWQFTGTPSLLDRRRIAIVSGHSLEEFDYLKQSNPEAFLIVNQNVLLNSMVDLVLQNRVNTAALLKRFYDYTVDESNKKQLKSAGCLDKISIYLAFSPKFSNFRKLIEYYDTTFPTQRVQQEIPRILEAYGTSL